MIAIGITTGALKDVAQDIGRDSATGSVMAGMIEMPTAAGTMASVTSTQTVAIAVNLATRMITSAITVWDMKMVIGKVLESVTNAPPLLMYYGARIQLGLRSQSFSCSARLASALGAMGFPITGNNLFKV